MRTLRKIRLIYKKFLRKFHKFFERAEIFVTDVLYDRKKSIGTVMVSLGLLPLSFIFLQAVRLRRFLYDRRIFASDILGCPVIVVGNLTLGGTGKTPVVEKIARELHERGRKVAVLSRGYKSKSEPRWKVWVRWITHQKEPPPKVVSNGKLVLLNSETAGDEPFMLAENLPGVVVLVDRDRVKAGRYAIGKFGVDILILDDGFQYFPLLGHINLLLIDRSNPFGNRHLLPRGILREPIEQISRASHVLVTKADSTCDSSLIGTIKMHTQKAEIMQCAHFPRHLSTLDKKEIRLISILQDSKIMAFSGIASPDSFEMFLSRNGATIVHRKQFVDHHRFSKSELENVFDAACAKGAEFAVTTEKDAVRMPKDFQAPIATYFLKIDIEITAGEEIFEDMISKFTSKECLF
ncbi:MAG: tetraacyldisaccharide 4'-kinase [Puniceicoccales bacterium]|jgi:tetraacyldisaccharide 4'-kinase|nr:tetraacyldisaccharide 4'-kinase [Puniceicoccales bacterium]